MLKTLTVKNIALIKNAEIAFQNGLNVLTGETGAGKSIIIDSLCFVLGGRADKTLIRHGADTASVTAEFLIFNNQPLEKTLEEYGIEFENELIVRRDMSADGVGNVRINGIKATIGMLKNVTDCIADIYGQHETHALLNETNHIRILDSFASENFELKQAVSSAYITYLQLKSKLKLMGNLADIYERRANLEFSISEIEAAALKSGEEDELDKLRTRLLNSETYISELRTSYDFLAGYENEQNAIAALSLTAKAIGKILDMDSGLLEISERLDSAKIELQDIAYSIADMLNSSEFDDDLAQRSEERKDLIRALKRKHGANVDEILDNLEKMRAEYALLDDIEGSVEKLEQEILIAENVLAVASQKLSDARKSAAKRLEFLLETELAAVGLNGAKLEIAFSKTTTSSNGCDDVVFNISINKGQPLKPLAKTVSGGEASRFMLCLKNIIAGLEGVDTMVFDEIDTGISGKIASAVAQKLYKISKERQVLAVTHLPQLAAMADAHFLIEKEMNEYDTYTKICKLSGGSELSELARLVGSEKGSAFALPHAEEMKKFANEFKRNN